MTERLPAFQLSDATPEQKAVLDEILSGPRGNLNGPFLGWIHSPELAQQAQRLARSAAIARACRCVCPNSRFS